MLIKKNNFQTFPLFLLGNYLTAKFSNPCSARTVYEKKSMFTQLHSFICKESLLHYATLRYTWYQDRIRRAKLSTKFLLCEHIVRLHWRVCTITNNTDDFKSQSNRMWYWFDWHAHVFRFSSRSIHTLKFHILFILIEKIYTKDVYWTRVSHLHVWLLACMIAR